MNLITLFASRLGLSPSFIYKTIRLAPHSYKRFAIPKKNRGVRIVQQPSKKVKALQALAVEEFFSKLPVHSCVYSYRKNLSIVNCASKHRKNNYLLRLDFQNFFGSITSNDVKCLLKDNADRFSISLNDEDVTLLSLLSCFYDKEVDGLRVVIGAPSSPSISNAMLYEFDCRIEYFCHSMAITYTRYADDLFFSTNEKNILHKVKNEVMNVLGDLKYPRLSLNHEKTYHTSKKHKKVVTGLVLTPDGAISVGRDRKREVKSLVFDFANGRLAVENLPYLRGLLSFIYSVEPDFIDRLRNKYGDDVVTRLWL